MKKKQIHLDLPEGIEGLVYMERAGYSLLCPHFREDGERFGVMDGTECRISKLGELVFLKSFDTGVSYEDMVKDFMRTPRFRQIERSEGRDPSLIDFL